MPRKSKGVHTSPLKAGEKNMPSNYPETHPDVGNTMETLYPIWLKSFENRENYKGLWTEETLAEQLHEFFKYCFEKDVKPSKSALCLWLDISKAQFHDWQTKAEKHGFKTSLLKKASLLIETSYIGRIEKYPTGNIFLLKTSHDHVETSKVEVENKSVGVTTEDVNSVIEKLGLNK
jgi:hypothetical protein